MEGLDFFGGGQEGELIPSDEQSDDDDMPDLDDIPEKKGPQLTDAQKADKFNEFMKAQNKKAEEALMVKLRKEGKLK